MKCKLSEKCEFGNLCKDATRHDSLIVLGCSSFKTKKPLTNEEWLCSLSTEEKAKWMFRLTYKCYWCGREYEKTKKYNEKECPFQKCLDDSKGFKKWLKEKHE